MTDNTGLYTEYYVDKPELIMAFDLEWPLSDNTYTDPKEQMWAAIQIYEREKDN